MTNNTNSDARIQRNSDLKDSETPRSTEVREHQERSREKGGERKTKQDKTRPNSSAQEEEERDEEQPSIINPVAVIKMKAGRRLHWLSGIIGSGMLVYLYALRQSPTPVPFLQVRVTGSLGGLGYEWGVGS